MNAKKELENTDISKNNSSLEQQKTDDISKLLANEEDFVSLIKKILDSEFEELFKKILNLPKIDFLNQLSSNVSLILLEQFSSKLSENEKLVSIITLTCHNFDNIYNKYMEELSEGWDQYIFEKMNQVQNSSEDKIQSFFLTKFRKHCIKTQTFACHQCKNGGKGNFITIYGNSNSQFSNSFRDKNKKKIKYLICDNCRESYFIKEFYNFCEYCNTNYLCSPLFKDEDENFLPATLNPPHCETFVNEELLCQKCKNILYIDIKNNKLKCGNKGCNYNVSIENNKKIYFTCKVCKSNFYSNVKIFNPIEVIHFKNIINKALLYKRKAFPGKLSCCREIKEKKTDFFHKKDCRGKLYFIEYNQKIIIICSKCKAVNQYSKFIWTCPECGIHFRDKKSEENEIKIRKIKSSNKLVKYKKLFPDLEDDNNSNVNDNRKSFVDLLKRRKSQYEKSKLIKSYYYIEKYNSERKILPKNKYLSEKKLNKTDDCAEKGNKSNDFLKKKKKMYIFNKILPWGRGKKVYSEQKESKNINNNNKNSEKKTEYYENKVNELINIKPYVPKIKMNKNENEGRTNICKSGRIHYKYYNYGCDSNCNNENNINESNKKFKAKNLYLKNFKDETNDNNKNLIKNLKEITNSQSSVELNYAFNKKHSPDSKNVQKDNDLKCKKFIPIKLQSSQKQESIIKEKNNNNENNNNGYNNKKIYLFKSQRFKRLNKEENSNSKRDIKKNIENKFNNNKESFQSKETTSKGSIESKNSLFSHSPQKDLEEEIKKNSNKIILKLNNYNEDKEMKEDDIIQPEKINPDEEIEIDDNKIKENQSLYNHIQRRLKKIMLKGKLPKFDLNKFTIEKQIGDGSFGIIYSVYNNKSKRKYAMKKIIASNINTLEAYQKEFEIVHQDRHPSILDIKGVFIKCFDQTTYALYVLMDLAERDWEMEINDREMIKDYYKEKDLIFILKQLTNGLYFLQKEKNVAHRDIKPENVLIFKNKNENKKKFGELLYKLCDFGEAKDYAKINSGKQKTLRGTELYMSPLLYNGLIHEEVYVDHNAFKSDVFSLGCCMIIAAALDFEIINEIRELKEQIKISEFLNKKLSARYSEKFIDILLKMINFNEEERIDFIQLEELIESKFLE